MTHCSRSNRHRARPPRTATPAAGLPTCVIRASAPGCSSSSSSAASSCPRADRLRRHGRADDCAARRRQARRAHERDDARTASLLKRVRLGEVGGIVLFKSFNITTQAALVAATAKLQAAATAGGWPPLLIMADQEGGDIRTIPWAPTSTRPARWAPTGAPPSSVARGTRRPSACSPPASTWTSPRWPMLPSAHRASCTSRTVRSRPRAPRSAGSRPHSPWASRIAACSRP